MRLRTEDNRTIEGAALIGADGLRSTIRQQMLDEGEPRTIGYVAHRTIVPMQDVKADVYRNEVVLWSGPGFHIVHYPLRSEHAVQHRRGVQDLDLSRPRRHRELSRRSRPHL